MIICIKKTSSLWNISQYIYFITAARSKHGVPRVYTKVADFLLVPPECSEQEVTVQRPHLHQPIICTLQQVHALYIRGLLLMYMVMYCFEMLLGFHFGASPLHA